MNRRDYYFKQAVTEAELDEGFDDAERADRAMITDQLLYGIFQGGGVVQHSPVANLTVDVGTMKAYDPNGQRIYIPGPAENVNIANDSGATPTAVAGGGNEKWISITAKFSRVLTDPRVDGNAATVYFNSAESFSIVVAQGAEAAVGVAVRPTLDPDGLLLADVHRTFGQATILNADISTTRRQDTYVLTGTPLSGRYGTPKDAMQGVFDTLNTHVNSGGHPSTAITSNAHAGTRLSLSATNVDTNLSQIQAALDGLMTGGADTIKQAGDIATLKGYASAFRRTNSIQAVVGRGVYFWNAASTQANDDHFFVRPTDVATDADPGRWELQRYNAIGEDIYNADTGAYSAGTYATVSATFVPVGAPLTASSSNNRYVAGDEILAIATIRTLVDAGGTVGEYILSFQEDATAAVDVAGSKRQTNSDTGGTYTAEQIQEFTLIGKYTVIAAAPTVVKAMARFRRVSGAGNVYVASPGNILMFGLKK